MDKNYKKIVLMLILSLILTCIGCGGQQNNTDEYILEDFAMNTLISIKVYSSDSDLANKALREAFSEFKRIELLTDRFAERNLPDPEKSDVYRINKNAGIRPVKVSEDTILLIEKSIQYGQLSDGAFDITIAPVMDLWGFGQEEKNVPAEDAINNKLALVDYKQIVLDPRQKTVFLPTKGMEIDLGGIAKGYATDMAVKKLKEYGIKSALVNAGGNVYALGTKPDGSPWLTGIQDPRDNNKIVAILKLVDCAAVTSGDYQRYFIQNGILYHHIIDPSTGKPARQVISSTIVGPNAVDADAMSTTCFILGYKKGIQNLGDNADYKVLFIDDKKNILFPEDFKDYLDFVHDGTYRTYSY